MVKGQGKRWEGTLVGQSPQGKAWRVEPQGEALDEIEKGQDEEGHDEKGQNKKGQVEKSQNVKTKRWTDEKTKRVKLKRDKKMKKGSRPLLFPLTPLFAAVLWERLCESYNLFRVWKCLSQLSW